MLEILAVENADEECVLDWRFIWCCRWIVHYAEVWLTLNSEIQWLILLKVLQPDSTSSAQAASRLFDAMQEAGVVFETIVEPVLF